MASLDMLRDDLVVAVGQAAKMRMDNLSEEVVNQVKDKVQGFCEKVEAMEDNLREEVTMLKNEIEELAAVQHQYEYLQLRLRDVRRYIDRGDLHRLKIELNAMVEGW